MTERKICEHKGSGAVDYEYWIPLDPQPCCANCINYVQGLKSLICEHFDRNNGSDFYCIDWELKE